MQTSDFAQDLRSLGEAFVHLARLTSLDLLAADRLDIKQERATRVVFLLEQAFTVESFLARYHKGRPFNIAWSIANHPERTGILTAGRLDRGQLSAAMSEATAALAQAIRQNLQSLGNVPLLEPEALLLRQLASVIPTDDHGSVEQALPLPVSGNPKPQHMTKGLNGPHTVGMDPVFAPMYSLQRQGVPLFGDSVSEVAPYFWTLATRETMAAELCALSLAEYDGLPLAFYRDMAKQTWDETRHASSCLNIAIRLLAEIETDPDADSEIRAIACTFHETGSGLPIPVERNLYQVAVNAGLVERLIMLHHDAETPAIRDFKDRMNASFSQHHPDIAFTFEVFRRDEISHSRIGSTWLRHLLPNRADREEALTDTRLLRNVWMLTSFAEYGGDRLIALVDRFSRQTANC